MASMRTWRTAFLTLRDETLTAASPVPQLLHDLIFSHSHSLISAASHLPPHEVTSDLLFLLDLAAHSAQHPNFDSLFTQTALLMHELCQSQGLPIQFISSSWILFLNSLSTILQTFLRNNATASTVKPAVQSIQTLRQLVNLHHPKFSLSDNLQLLKFLLPIVELSYVHLVYSSTASAPQKPAAPTAKSLSKYTSFWELHTDTFAMLGETFMRVGSSVPADIWQSTIEALRKVMDALALKSLLVEDVIMSRFYASLLNSLHLVLVNPKASLLDHVSGFVTTLRMFFIYGLTIKQLYILPACHLKEKDISTMHLKLTVEEPTRKDRAPYRPPHLRQKDSLIMKQPKARDSLSFSDHESSTAESMSSDSDCSDSDGAAKETDSIQSSKVRVAAIVCIQDLCQADPKSFTTQWTMLLPTNDVLQPRKSEATLMTCLLFDPHLKVRIASASTLAVMLDGPSSVFLQVAEYNETSRWGSFMALSSSLGRILMQLHIGILYLIQHETCSRMLPSFFKILMLLMSSTPYSRMPGELLPTVITSLLSRTDKGFPFRSDQTALLATAINCLTAALSTLPPSPHVKQMLVEETSTGVDVAEKRSGVLSTLLHYSNHPTNSAICFEGLQALRAVIHNYPNIAFACWEQVILVLSKKMRVAVSEAPVRAGKGHVGDNVGFTGEKVLTAAIKVLDVCLRATSGFKGTEDLDDKLLDNPFTADCIRTKKVSSAPSYEPESTEDIKEELQVFEPGCQCWSETLEKHIPPMLQHPSFLVRTASLTCFAGITSSVFISLAKERQEFVISCLINAAVHDGVPSVRSATCRAIGVVSCFPQVSHSAEILVKFIHAVEINTRDPLVSVRITASWALANICGSLQHCIDDFPVEKYADLNGNLQVMEFLAECALQLTKDGDKVKSNAVRALGNLSRFVRVASVTQGDSHLLERMVQAFLSCVTTGNVKVQWNVCHALSNLFLNETLRLQDMDWSPSVFSILLLLLRDSSNFKIRIQAAAALAVPASVLDYGESFSDVVQGLEHVVENLGSDKISTPSSFKYRVVLEKQVTSTLLHVLSLASSTDHQSLKDFIVKKAPFLEEWLKNVCLSLGDTSGRNSVENLKKQVISRAIHSLIKVFESKNHHAIAHKFEKLDK
ncbi:uncharacterized protein LOC126676898 [Mercurialis annua]|uniref:uncharacterized protein LOC126676898 n=1 Tax=Mercurialis annua TaxID=3986 RepID=UPI002160A61A|nr:uncharacterized protein LOC126676898 [Mercurialis annua]